MFVLLVLLTHTYQIASRSMAKKSDKSAAAAAPDPETEEKQRLRALAVSNGLLRRTPVRPVTALGPSKAAIKLDGRDIVKRGQRKSRYLFSFPGLLAPLSAGRIGELADLATKNPLLYLEFPQGRLKLFGTHVYPKNRYLTLQLTKSAKGIMCEDSFESLIVFSEARWIGKKEENPEELQLEFPKDLAEEKPAYYDFKGGAGASAQDMSHTQKVTEYANGVSPDTEIDEDMPEESNLSVKRHSAVAVDVKPTRHSARTTGEKFNYAEPLSEEDSISSDTGESEEIVEEQVGTKTAATRSLFDENKVSRVSTSIDMSSTSKLVQKRIKLSEKRELSSLSVGNSKEKSAAKKGALVQATLSTLFEKAVDTKSKLNADDPPQPKGLGDKKQRSKSKQTSRGVQLKESNGKEVASSMEKTGGKTRASIKLAQAQSGNTEEIEQISSD